MKKLSLLLLVFVALFTLSCSNSNETTTIVDDYKLLSVTSEGKIFEIGNNTGNTINIGQITNQSKFIKILRLILYLR